MRKIVFCTILALAALMPVAAQVKTSPMGKINHYQRWYDQAMSDFGNQKGRLKINKGINGIELTPDGLMWKAMSITSGDMMPFAAIDNRLILIAREGHDTYSVNVDGQVLTLRPNVAQKVAGDKELLLLTQQVARAAYKLNNHLIYGRRGGALFQEKDDRVWEEIWAAAESQSEKKELHDKTSVSDKSRFDTYLLNSSLGKVEAHMVHGTNDLHSFELWRFNITPEIEANTQSVRHYLYLEVKAKGKLVEIAADGKIISWSGNDSTAMYIDYEQLKGHNLILMTTPHNDGYVDVHSLRLIECRQEALE